MSENNNAGNGDPLTMVESQSPEGDGRVYWRSMEQLADSSDYQRFLKGEFPPGTDLPPSDVSRRGFMGYVAAAVALAGATACRKPERKILPFAKRPEEMLPGVPEYYATAFNLGGYGTGSLVRSNDGRPTKVEGNPLHPSSLGSSSAYMQGEVLNLYDPARSQAPCKRGAEATTDWKAFEGAWRTLAGQLRGKQGEGLAFLMGSTTSPAVHHMVEQVKEAFPKAAFHVFDSVNRDSAVAGTALAFGKAMDAQFDLSQADVVVSFASDFLGLDGNAVRHSRDFAGRRKLAEGGELNRLYAIESDFSVTGSQADHRFALRPSEIVAALFALAAELGVLRGALGQAVAKHKEHAFRKNGKNWVEVLARDLRTRTGRTLLAAGPSLPPVAHAVVAALNVALGNSGKTVTYTETPALAATAQVDSLKSLTEAMDAGRVDTLFILGGNPVYTAPADLDFGAKLAKVKNSIHLGLHRDETGMACAWHLNEAHDLEAWGDIRAHDGTVSIIQPLVAPLYGGRSALEVLALVADADEKAGYEVVRYYWEDNTRTEDFGAWWNRALHDGLVHGTAAKGATASVRGDAIARAVGEARPQAGEWQVVFRQDALIYDGRYSNNAWMQESPDPVTKLTWDNAALIGWSSAKALGIEKGDMIEVSADGRTLEIPVWIVPGVADKTVILSLGYGRDLGSDHKVASGAGFNVGVLRTAAGFNVGNGTVRSTGASYELVSTQDHGAMEGRDHYRQSDLAGYKENPRFAPDKSPLALAAKLAHGPEGAAPKTEKDLLKSLWEERNYTKGPQWGMVIDLNACDGCGACVVACQSENNIPTVGKAEVKVGREMNWLRIDRYFTTDSPESEVTEGGVPVTDDPGMAHLPVPCLQCENAPCESVCPVAATTHSPDGLNDMAYNRCIGTRYCSNNCPVKVRKFNWFDWTASMDGPTYQMAQNPDVTVRSRGVMEKCTYCVQRINRGKFDAANERRPVQDGEIVPACAQTCPSQAITFGDIVDENSAISKLRKSDLHYAMLSELNIKPRTTYLARVSNPNPELS